MVAFKGMNFIAEYYAGVQNESKWADHRDSISIN